MRTINLVLLIGIMLLLLPGISFATSVMSCGEVSSSLTLTNNLEGAPINAAPLSGTACVKIIASNLVFDCNGFNITNNGTGGTTYGILLNGSLSNVTVRNCPGVSSYEYGIYSYQSEYIQIINNSVSTNNQFGIALISTNFSNVTDNVVQYSDDGIVLQGSSGNRLANNNVSGNTYYGFYLNSNSENNTLQDNNAVSNSRAGVFITNSNKNNLTDNNASANVYYGIWIDGSNSNTLLRNNASNTFIPTTYHLSQLGIFGEWNEIYSSPFYAKYSTKQFQFSKNNGAITLRIVQNGSVPFADVDAARLFACRSEIEPEYARYVDSGQSVLEKIRAIDNEVILTHDSEFEVSWDILDSCNEPAVLYLTANEYAGGLPLFFPNAGYATVSGDSAVPLIDGSLNETDGISIPSYSAFWIPDSGHPEGYTYIYTSQDDENVYISLDITSDNTNEYGEDWAEITFSTPSGKKAFRIDDYNDLYGKCGFGYTSKVPYEHQTCEFSIPKSEINDANLNFGLRYYGTEIASASAIQLRFSNNNTLEANQMSQTNNGYGCYLYQSSSNNLTDNVANDNSRDGIYLIDSSYNRLTNNTASSNTGYGLSIYNSNHTTVISDHYYGNSRDLGAYSYSNQNILNLANVIFDNPFGNLVNYTGLSLSDNMDAGDAYSISWAQTPSSPPNQSFEYKTLDIAPISGTPSIDSLSMNWLDSELSGYNENGFQLWKYDEAWTNMNAALNAAANTLTLTNFVPASYYSILQGEAPPQVTSTSSSGSDPKKPLAAVYGQICPDNQIQVNVTSSGSALENAEVRLIYMPTYDVFDKLTDSSGSAVFSALKTGEYKLIVSKSKYFSYENSFTLSTCSGQDTTAPKNITPPEQPPVSPPTTVIPECTTDSDCASEEYCSNGSCTDVTGSCGIAANHIWTSYECCSDGDCQSTSSCKNHKCTLKSFDITGSNGSVGSNSTVTLFADGAPLANTELKVTKPDGSYEILTTDSAGKITFPLSQAGDYTIEFLSGGSKLDSLTVTASEKEPEPEAPIPILGVIAQLGVVFLLLILLLVGAFLIYRFFISKGKGGKK